MCESTYVCTCVWGGVGVLMWRIVGNTECWSSLPTLFEAGSLLFTLHMSSQLA